MTSRTNADPKCVSWCAKLVSTESVCGCNRRSFRHSQPARYALQTFRRNGRHETLRTNDIHQSSLMPCKLRTRPYRGNMLWYERECVRVQHDMLWYENECSYSSRDMLWYENVCSHVPYDMLWCARCMFTYTVQYALVCNMNVCMYHMICLVAK